MSLAAGAVLASLAVVQPALADRWDHRGGWHHHGGPRVSLNFDVWRGGHWHHGWYGPRYGWWWSVPSAGYYYYPEPVYPYPDYYRPPTVIVERDAPPPPASGPPPQQFWYYCKDSDAYYPYVDDCRSEWRKVPAKPEGQ
jgi:hypothetical protein